MREGSEVLADADERHQPTDGALQAGRAESGQRRPTFGSLFAGIGGIDLGLERAGWEGRWQVEYEPYCTRVLERHWPDVARAGDIRDTHAVWDCPNLADASGERPRAGRLGSEVVGGPERPEQEAVAGPPRRHCVGCLEPVDLIAGGFPCQPFSNAGKRLGKADERWLWPEFARTIGALRPRYVLVENVPGLLAGHGGMGAVLGDLASLGYDASWDSIPAAAVGAPHLRYRVWIVARRRPLADADDEGPQGHRRLHREWDGAGKWFAREGGIPVNDWWLVEPDVGGTLDGFPAWLDRRRERLVTPHMLDLANAYEGGPREALRAVRRDADAAAVRDQARGSGGVPPSEVLLTYVRELEDGVDQGRLSLASAEASGAEVRGVWPDKGPARPSRRRRPVEQRSGQSPDALYALSQLLARDAGAAWAAYRREDAESLLSRWGLGWEDGIPRVSKGVPARVDRLRALGNAVVPQVVEWIGRRILEAEAVT